MTHGPWQNSRNVLEKYKVKYCKDNDRIKWTIVISNSSNSSG